MRELKFRVWSKKYQRYLPLNDCLRLGVDQILTIPIKSENEYIIQQYIGQKDIDSKEIYEGDIVKYQYIYRPDEDEIRSEYIGEVKFESGVFYPRQMSFVCEDPWYSWKITNLKVLGNIFENPELLK